MKNISPIIETEINKNISDLISKGHSKEEAFMIFLEKVKNQKRENPLVAIHWEIEKAMNLISNNES